MPQCPSSAVGLLPWMLGHMPGWLRARAELKVLDALVQNLQVSSHVVVL